MTQNYNGGMQVKKKIQNFKHESGKIVAESRKIISIRNESVLTNEVEMILSVLLNANINIIGHS